jgi:hypothetical protein
MNQITNCMELRPWQAASCSAIQEFPNIFWNPKVHYRVHKSLPLDTMLSQTNSVHTIPPYFYNTHFTSPSHLHLGLPSGLFPSGFPTKILYTFLFSLACYMPYTCSFTWSFEFYLAKSTSYWSFSRCNFLQPIISSLFSPNILLSTLFPNTLYTYDMA